MDQRTIRAWVAVVAWAVMAFGVPGTAMADGFAPTAGPIAASDHTCAITPDAGVTCWGDNSAGGLGDGTKTTSLDPVDVVGLASGVTVVAVGDRYSCALTTGGGVKCWGLNESGQLGDGSAIDRTSPVDVEGLASGVTAIAARGVHTCALTTGGGVKCWGWNNKGQLGDGSTVDSAIPVDVVGLTSGVTAIAAGGEHTCALTTGGGVKCWGWNNKGQLGDGTSTDSSTPVSVEGLTSGASAISTGGRHTCALLTAGGIKCWGYGEAGQLGDGTITDSATPVVVAGLVGDATLITLGGNFTCARMAVGTLSCWGLDLTGAAVDATVPAAVAGLDSGVEAIVAGYYHACALKAGGVVACWGGNDTGQLGSGTTTDSLSPIDVVGADGTPVIFGTTRASQTQSPFLIASAVALGIVLVAAAGYVTVRRRRR